MSKPLKPRRGTTAEQNDFVGEAYEVTYDTDKNTLVCRDGLTAGGFPLAKEEQVAKCLKTSGGEMNGTIVFNNLFALQGADTGADGGIFLSGNKTAPVGGSLFLYKSTDPTFPGAFVLRGRSGGEDSQLIGKPTGELTWAGRNIVRSVNGVSANVNGDVRGMPAGTVIAFAANKAPSGFLLCNGATVSRSTYADLFAAIGTTYGAGDGSSTFNLPDLTNKFIQGSGTAGTEKAAGLPGITGGLSYVFMGTSNSPSGALSASAVDSTYRYVETGGTSSHWKKVTFDASKASTNAGNVYGKSNTVQPPALTMRYYIKY